MLTKRFFSRSMRDFRLIGNLLWWNDEGCINPSLLNTYTTSKTEIQSKTHIDEMRSCIGNINTTRQGTASTYTEIRCPSPKFLFETTKLCTLPMRSRSFNSTRVVATTSSKTQSPFDNAHFQASWFAIAPSSMHGIFQCRNNRTLSHNTAQPPGPTEYGCIFFYLAKLSLTKSSIHMHERTHRNNYFRRKVMRERVILRI